MFQAGGYRYIKAVFQYSGGVAAEPGYEIERAAFREASVARRCIRGGRSPPWSDRAADQPFCSLRAEIAGAVHRAGFLLWRVL